MLLFEVATLSQQFSFSVLVFILPFRDGYCNFTNFSVVYGFTEIKKSHLNEKNTWSGHGSIHGH